MRHGARAHCEATAADLRRAIEGRPQTGSIRFLHNLDWSIAEQVVAAVEELGGATQLIAAAPFWDDGAAIDGLCAALRLDSVLIHAHAHEAVEGRAGANWPAACRSAVQPVRLDVMTEADKPRRLHAKAFEILCRQGRIVVSGSANATGAALEADGNVEACVVRMQRERKTGWTFVPAEVPDPQPALETDDDEDLQKCGVLRAVLDGDSLQGEVLTPAMTGALNVSYLSGAGEQALGAAALSPDRRFEISAPALEDLSFLGGRLVIRVLDSKGRVAEGFVSIASFAEVTRRAGIAARRLLALLAGTETPADVAAIMSWFHDNPGALAGSAPQGLGGGDDHHAKKPEEIVVVASLSGAAVAAAQAGAAERHKAGGRGWSRFMEQILSAFRQKRGAFGAAGGEGKGDDDDDGGDDENDKNKNNDKDKDREIQRERDAIEKSLANFQKLFDLLLKPGQPARQALIAFDLTLYVCERLCPDKALAVKWLKQLVKVLLEKGVPPERRDDVAGAVLTLLGVPAEYCNPRWARGCLLGLGIDLAKPQPAPDAVQGLHAVLPQSRSFEELWTQVQSIRTFPEQVRSYVAALDGKASPADFPDLPGAAEEEWEAMKKALQNNNAARKVLVCEKFPATCPEHHLGIPNCEEQKLHSFGIATAKNCCRRILVWTGGS